MTDEEKAAAQLLEEQKPAEETVEVKSLKEQLGTATERIAKYDGERKDYSEQTNLIENLKKQVESLIETVQTNEDEDTNHLSVTQEELREFKLGENERFEKFNKDQVDKTTAEKAEYQKYLGEESLAVKDEILFDLICKEHDALVSNGGMPESTGNLKVDARIAWKEAENSYYRKVLAAKGDTNFKDVKDVKDTNKPVVPGQKELSTSTDNKQTTTMPDNLPDDAKEFIAMMGDTNNPDSVNRALGR